MPDLVGVAETGYDRTNDRHRSLLCSLVMTASDLSDQEKYTSYSYLKLPLIP